MVSRTRETLADRLRAGPLSVREATQICRALLSEIAAARARGATLGAIAPTTIVLEEGHATIAPAGEGTPSPQSGPADVYAVATVLYEAVTGRPWSPGTTTDSADWSRIPRRLRRALRKALNPVPERRWPEAGAFERALWVPRPSDPIWPALLVILFAAAVIATIVLCKPLGLCWERQPPAETR